MTWKQTYNWSWFDSAYSGIETTDGCLAIIGSSNPPRTPEPDFRLSKLDPNGNEIWSHLYGGDGPDFGLSVIQTEDGGYALTGYTCSYGAGVADAWLIKTNADGKVIWQRTYGDTNHDLVNTVIQTEDGGYLLAGQSASYSQSGFDGWLVKTDHKGNLQWNQTYGGIGWDEIESVVQTSDKGYVFAGVLSSGEDPSPAQLWIAKTNATGVIQWSYSHGTIWNDQAYSIIQTSDEGYAIAGRNIPDITGANGPDFWLMKTDSNGLIEWNYTYGGMEIDIARSIVQTDDGGYVLLGETDSFGAGRSDFWLIKTNATGTMEWNQTFGGLGSEFPYSLIPTSDGGLVLIGNTDPPDVQNYDYLIIKVGGKLISGVWTTTRPSRISFTSTPFILLTIGIIIRYSKFNKPYPKKPEKTMKYTN